MLSHQPATASAVAIDYENDPITFVYDWSVNNVPVQSGQQPTLASEYFSAGQVVSVSVTPSDAFGTGTSVTKSLTVQNASSDCRFHLVDADNTDCRSG